MGVEHAIPPAIRAWLVDLVERFWPDAAERIERVPDRLEAGQVRCLVSGGPFGLMIDGRLDEVDGRLALEVLENDRMSGESYYRVWEDGTIETLDPVPKLGYTHGPDATPEEIAAVEQAYFSHNRAAYDHLRSRGFLGG